ncbi:hypothetical protein [Hydrogenophilus thiooxidans]|uniref:hypothetical protein n=1 Tax=Hydrogenophilus thiooxidans TaxID=2820326 RepID=UPI001C2356DA|nr:hypothetical protein [Hydrogenophilus thiooxidans]
MSANELYRFSIANGTVSGVFEIEHGRVKAKAIKPGTTYTVQGNQVIKTEIKKGVQKVTVYDDSDGDGYYVELSHVNTWPGTSGTGSGGVTGTGAGNRAGTATGPGTFRTSYGSQKQFQFNADGTLQAVLEVKNGWTKAESLWQYRSVEAIDDLVLVQKITGKWEIYRDGNGDGVYTEVAEGYGDVHAVDLTGIVSATNANLSLL